MKLVIFGLTLCAIATLTARGTSQSSVAPASTLEEGLLDLRFGTVPYRLFVPQSASRGRGHPLIVFLHGGAGRGRDNQAHLRDGNGMLIDMLIRDSQADPAFVVAPQATEEHDAEDVVGLVKNVSRRHRVDVKRIYIVGQSLGGLGLMAAVRLEPKMFAGAVMIAASAEPSAAEYLRQIPVWVLHGENDVVFPVQDARRLVAAIRKRGGSVRYTEYADEGHGLAWLVVRERALVSWLMSQTLN